MTWNVSIVEKVRRGHHRGAIELLRLSDCIRSWCFFCAFRGQVSTRLHGHFEEKCKQCWKHDEARGGGTKRSPKLHDMGRKWRRMSQNEAMAWKRRCRSIHTAGSVFPCQERKNRLDQKRKERATCTAYAVPLVIFGYGMLWSMMSFDGFEEEYIRWRSQVQNSANMISQVELAAIGQRYPNIDSVVAPVRILARFVQLGLKVPELPLLQLPCDLTGAWCFGGCFGTMSLDSQRHHAVHNE